MKFVALSILITAVLLSGAILLSSKGGANGELATAENTRVTDGTQFIDISAKGGYSPRVTLAKADIPTVINMETQGTFDCSSSLVIPALKYRANLQPSGVTEIKIPPQKAGTVLQGLCSMGMYSFSIRFN